MSNTQTINPFDLQTNKVVVLGGCGFLGLHVAQHLINNQCKVVLIDSASRTEQIPRGMLSNHGHTVEISYPYQETSVLESVLQKGDVLIHLGWSQVPNDNRRSYQIDIAENMAFSTALFDLATTAGVSKIIFASSGGSIYGNSSNSPLTETSPTEPISSYGIAKLATEKYLQLLTKDTATLAVNLRIGNAYGLHLSPSLTPTGLIPFFISALNDQRTVDIWGDGEAVRDFIHVSDIAAAFSAAIQTPDLSGTFNIGTGIGTSINQLIALIEKSMKQTVPISNTKGRRCDVTTAVLDASEFKRLTNWLPRVSLQQGVMEVIDKNSPRETITSLNKTASSQ